MTRPSSHQLLASCFATFATFATVVAASALPAQAQAPAAAKSTQENRSLIQKLLERVETL